MQTIWNGNANVIVCLLLNFANVFVCFLLYFANVIVCLLLYFANVIVCFLLYFYQVSKLWLFVFFCLIGFPEKQENKQQFWKKKYFHWIWRFHERKINSWEIEEPFKHALKLLLWFKCTDFFFFFFLCPLTPQVPPQFNAQGLMSWAYKEEESNPTRQNKFNSLVTICKSVPSWGMFGFQMVCLVTWLLPFQKFTKGSGFRARVKRPNRKCTRNP